MEKSADAFRTISEVAEDLKLPQHVLRFWESRFPQIRPLKRGGGRRYYRPDDIQLLRAIRHLLYGEGYTIKGVQRILKDQGARAVLAQDGHDPSNSGGDLPLFREHAFAREESGPAEPGATCQRKEGADGSLPLDGANLTSGLALSDEDPAPAGSSNILSRDEIHVLKSALFEIVECGRILEAAAAAR